MTDKIKVWKCEECNPPTMCYSNGENKPDQCSFNQGHLPDMSQWKDITERKPETMTEKMVKAFEPEIKKIMELTPRKRVKIIWPEVTAENVEIACALKYMDGDILEKDSDEFMDGRSDGSEYFNVSDIPESWLEDIPTEPRSVTQLADDALRELGIDTQDGNKHVIALHGVRLGEANNELRHAETVSMEQCFRQITAGRHTNWEIFKFGWKSHGKSHNLK